MTRPHHPPSKCKSYPVMMVGLLFCIALITTVLTSQPAHAAFGVANPKHEQAMLWPLLPGESLNSLAIKLYPQSPVLQQRFVQQAISLSRSRGILLTADQRAASAQLIAVPNAQTLHTVTHRIKKADEVDADTFAPPAGLVMSVQLTQAAQESGWHMPDFTLPALHLPEWMTLKGHSFSVTNLAGRVAAVNTHITETYQANTQAIARTPVQRLYQQPQLALIVGSAVLLLLLSLLWGVLERRRTH